MTPLWITNIPILYEKKYLFEIIPLKKFDFNRKLNALVRLSIYYSVIVFILDRENTSVFYIPLIVTILTYVLSRKFKNTAINQTNVELFNNKVEDEEDEEENQELVSSLNETCKIPTKNNPFMNPTIMDYGREGVKPACPSYNNKGIIPLEKMQLTLEKYGELYKIPVDHNVYNKFIGIAAKKRQKKHEKIEEFLYLLDCREKLK